MSFRKVARMRQVLSFCQPGSNECPSWYGSPWVRKSHLFVKYDYTLDPRCMQKDFKNKWLGQLSQYLKLRFPEGPNVSSPNSWCFSDVDGPQLILMNSPYLLVVTGVITPINGLINEATAVVTPISGVITLLIAGRGPTLSTFQPFQHWSCLCLRRRRGPGHRCFWGWEA